MPDIIKILTFKLDHASVTEYTNSATIETLDNFNTVKDESNFTTQNNVALIYWKGNFQEWKIKIYRYLQTNSEWDTVVDNVTAFNGLIIDFYPDTVNEAATSYKAYFSAIRDTVNEYPNEFIYLDVKRVYSEDNEP